MKQQLNCTWVLLLLVGLCVHATLAQDRATINPDYQWKLNQIYPTLEAWQKDVAGITAGVDLLAAYKGKFAGPAAATPARSLIEYNKSSEDIMGRLERAMNFVQYHFDVDMGSAEWTGRQQQMQDLAVAISQKLSWEEPELLQIPRDTLMAWIDRNPELKTYRKTYEDMYLLRQHTLSAPEEEILALSGNVTSIPNDVFDKFTSVDMDFGTVVDEKGDTVRASYETWESNRTSKNRQVRENFFNAVWGQYKKYENTFAVLMAGTIKKDIYYAKARKYSNTLERALAPSFIPVDVYTNLVSTTRANTAPLHKYDAIRKRLLGVDHYSHWDYYVSFSKGQEKRYTWEQGVAMVQDAVKPLGTKYVDDITTALTAKNGWVDVYSSKGKTGGAYSSSTYGIHPYMLFNVDYSKGLSDDDVSAVAHEVGHAMHTFYSEKAQPFPNKDYATFNAEVASTTNETLLAMKLLDEARKAYKSARGPQKEQARQHLINLLEQNISSGRDTFYRQVMFATWEWEAHKLGEEGKPMTAESFDKLYSDLLKEWHGPAAEYGDLSGVSWATIPHFYRGYYVYAYATSYAAAVALAQDIRAEQAGDKAHKGAADRYLNYLKSGSSKHPVELLKDAGVDMTTPAPIQSFIAYWSKLVDELDALTTDKK